MRRLPAGAAKIFVYRLPRLLCQLEANRSTRLLLTDAGSIKRATIGRDITDAQRNEIAASQLAVGPRVKSAKSRRRRSSCNLAQIDHTWRGRNGCLGPILFPLFHAGREVAASEDVGSRLSMLLV